MGWSSGRCSLLLLSIVSVFYIMSQWTVGKVREQTRVEFQTRPWSYVYLEKYGIQLPEHTGTLDALKKFGVNESFMCLGIDPFAELPMIAQIMMRVKYLSTALGKPLHEIEADINTAHTLCRIKKPYSAIRFGVKLCHDLNRKKLDAQTGVPTEEDVTQLEENLRQQEEDDYQRFRAHREGLTTSGIPSSAISDQLLRRAYHTSSASAAPPLQVCPPRPCLKRKSPSSASCPPGSSGPPLVSFAKKYLKQAPTTIPIATVQSDRTLAYQTPSDLRSGGAAGCATWHQKTQPREDAEISQVSAFRSLPPSMHVTPYKKIQAILAAYAGSSRCSNERSARLNTVGPEPEIIEFVEETPPPEGHCHIRRRGSRRPQLIDLLSDDEGIDGVPLDVSFMPPFTQEEASWEETQAEDL